MPSTGPCNHLALNEINSRPGAGQPCTAVRPMFSWPTPRNDPAAHSYTARRALAGLLLHHSARLNSFTTLAFRLP